VPGSLPSELDVRAFVYEWYRKLDAHADVKQYVPLLSDSELEMVFPEATLRDVEAFSAWYCGKPAKFSLPGVTNIFFDEMHELKRVDVSITGTDTASTWQAIVLIVVKWEAHRWTPPKAKSEYLGFDAWQRWVLKIGQGGAMVVTQYVVDKLEKLEGSADL
jgi:hypothetical protein